MQLYLLRWLPLLLALVGRRDPEPELGRISQRAFDSNLSELIKPLQFGYDTFITWFGFEWMRAEFQSMKQK